MNIEKWLPILGYEGIYEVSNLGEIRSLDRKVYDGRGFRLIKGKKLSNNNGKYLCVTLSNGKLRKTVAIHRVVCETFIFKENSKLVVNHKDLNKHNNAVENLEWCTQKENYNHAFKLGKIKPYWIGKKRDKETILKISNSKKGCLSNRKGITLNQSTKDKISKSLKGNTPWNKGLKIK